MRFHRLIGLTGVAAHETPTARRWGRRLEGPMLVVALWIPVLAGLVAACAELPSGHIRFGLATAPVTLDPRYATDAVSYRISRLIYQSLVEFDAAFRPVPALASWQQITPTCYRFRLG